MVEDTDSTDYLEGDSVGDEVEDEDEAVNEPSVGGTIHDSWHSIAFECDLRGMYHFEFLTKRGKKLAKYPEDGDWFLLREINLDILADLEWRMEDNMEYAASLSEDTLNEGDEMKRHYAEEERLEWERDIKRKRYRIPIRIKYLEELVEDDNEEWCESDDGEEPPDLDEFSSRLYGIQGIGLEADYHHLDATNWPEHSFEDDIEWNPERRWPLQIRKKMISPMFNECYFVCYYKRSTLFYLLEEYTEALMDEEILTFYEYMEEETAPQIIRFIRFVAGIFIPDRVVFPWEDSVVEVERILPYDLKYPLSDPSPLFHICPEDLLLDQFISAMLRKRNKKKNKKNLTDEEFDFLKKWGETYFPWVYENDTKGNPVSRPPNLLKSLWVPSGYFRANTIVQHLWTFLSMDEASRITFMDMDDDSFGNLQLEMLCQPLELLDLALWEDEFWANLVSFTPITQKDPDIGFFDSANGRGYLLLHQENIDYDCFAEYEDFLCFEPGDEIEIETEDNKVKSPVLLIEGRRGIYFFTATKDLNLK